MARPQNEEVSMIVGVNTKLLTSKVFNEHRKALDDNLKALQDMCTARGVNLRNGLPQLAQNLANYCCFFTSTLLTEIISQTNGLPMPHDYSFLQHVSTIHREWSTVNINLTKNGTDPGKAMAALNLFTQHLVDLKHMLEGVGATPYLTR